MLHTEITRLRGERNTAGGCRIELVAVDGVATMPAELNGTIPIGTPVVLATGYAWTAIWPTRATQVFAEDWTAKEGARMSRASLEWVIPKDRAELLGQLWDLRRMRCLVIHYDENGTAKLMGTKDEPAMVSVTELQHGNGPGQGANQYILRATSVRRRMCPFYGPASSADPVPPPPPCPSMAQLIGAALPTEVIAALTESQLLYMTAYFNDDEFCPTLSELIATASTSDLLTALSDDQEAALLLALGEYADALVDPLTPTTDVLIDPL